MGKCRPRKRMPTMVARGAEISVIRDISAAAVLLGAFGIITPAVGALVHNASSVAVVANSARLLNKKIKP